MIVGDSNISKTTMLLKVGSTDLVLRMIEAGTVPRDMTLDNPIRAIREVSHDMTGRSRVRLANGREMSALEIQYEYLNRAKDFTSKNGLDAISKRVLEMWERALRAIETGNLDAIAREINWVTKYQLIEHYRAKRDLPLSAPRIAQLDLAYHDVSRGRGLYYLLQRNGTMWTGSPRTWTSSRPSPSRRKLPGRSCAVSSSAEPRRSGATFPLTGCITKLNDQAQRTVLCKDPFRSVDERVEKLIASMLKAQVSGRRHPHGEIRAA